MFKARWFKQTMLACQRLWHTEAHITSSVQLFWCCTAHSLTWKKSSWMFCLIIFRHQISFLVLINMSVSPMAVMMKLIGKSEFIHSPFLLTLSANHFNVWLCAHHVSLSASVTCRLWVRVDCKCVCMSACTFHKCILQDVYASLNSVEIPHPLACTVNIYAGAIFSLHIDTAPRHDFRLLLSLPPFLSPSLSLCE